MIFALFFWCLAECAAIWLVLAPIAIAIAMSGRQMPQFLTYVLFAASIVVTPFAAIIAGAVAIVVNFALSLSLRFFVMPIQQVVAWVTIPFVLLGSGLQLLATWFVS